MTLNFELPFSLQQCQLLNFVPAGGPALPVKQKISQQALCAAAVASTLAKLRWESARRSSGSWTFHPKGIVLKFSTPLKKRFHPPLFHKLSYHLITYVFFISIRWHSSVQRATTAFWWPCLLHQRKPDWEGPSGCLQAVLKSPKPCQVLGHCWENSSWRWWLVGAYSCFLFILL